MSNRRQFLTGALGGAVAGLTVPSAFAAQAISPLPKKWDMTADVVVLGFRRRRRHHGHRRRSERREGDCSERILRTLTAFRTPACPAASSTARSRTAIRRL